MINEDDLVEEMISLLRIEIDELDDEIIKKVRLRTEKAARIARLKRFKNKPMITGKREVEVASKYTIEFGKLARTMGSALFFRSNPPELDKINESGDSPKEDLV